MYKRCNLDLVICADQCQITAEWLTTQLFTSFPSDFGPLSQFSHPSLQSLLAIRQGGIGGNSSAWPPKLAATASVQSPNHWSKDIEYQWISCQDIQSRMGFMQEVFVTVLAAWPKSRDWYSWCGMLALLCYTWKSGTWLQSCWRV